jgi:polyhydroxyalkanoate synthesis repressor PhaR
VVLLHRNADPLVTIVKKYGNRRLYDTELSRYITLEELADRIRAGADIEVVDAKTGRDLTQATLTQLILEGPSARLLPVPLLRRLLRMQDDALAEFFGRYVSGALELYNQTRSGVQQVTPYFPFAQMPMQADDAFFRMFSGGPAPRAAPPPPREPEPEPERAPPPRDDVADLRRELEELKRVIRQVGSQVAGGKRGSEDG